MDENRINLLTERQREALRLRHRRWKVKEIAGELGISENTVSSYLTEAATVLGGGRDGAVRLLASFEAAHPEARGRFSVGDGPATAVPGFADAAQQAEPAPSWRALLPLRMGSDRNELSIVVRLAWILALALGGAVAFGALANGARVLGDLLLAIHRAR